jgi:hypothetical protein
MISVKICGLTSESDVETALAFGNDGVGREAVVGPAQRDALHDDLVVGDAGMLAHHRATA